MFTPLELQHTMGRSGPWPSTGSEAYVEVYNALCIGTQGRGDLSCDSSNSNFAIKILNFNVLQGIDLMSGNLLLRSN